jgi:peroxiredoxin Q/BCP
VIEVGRTAPVFTLLDGSGVKHAIKDLRGRAVVLYFYPKDSTSGCTTEALEFQAAFAAFKRAGASVFGISPDSVASHAKFAEAQGLAFPLLADGRDKDDNPKVCLKYGVWQEKSMYGRKYMGVVRTTYLLAPSGKVVKRWDKVKVSGHAADVLAEVKALRKNTQ